VCERIRLATDHDPERSAAVNYIVTFVVNRIVDDTTTDDLHKPR
jgi:hypothetical protein